MSEPERLAVMAELGQRLAEARSRAARGGPDRGAAVGGADALHPARCGSLPSAAGGAAPDAARCAPVWADHQQFASAAIGVSLLLWLVLSGLRSARPSDIARIASAAMVWALLFIALTGFYAYRFEASEIFGRITGELLPSEPQVGARRGSRSSTGASAANSRSPARVNGARVTFLFDTGASTVVLTAEDARRAGVDTSRLVFDVPVATANGAAMAAEVRLDQIAVGPIVMRNVPAMVARRGALDESLLGMSFLERLKSYTVERDRLILVAK